MSNDGCKVVRDAISSDASGPKIRFTPKKVSCSVDKTTKIHAQLRQSIKQQVILFLYICFIGSLKMQQALPNYRSIRSVPVDKKLAHWFLKEYVEATETTPYLLPNAFLEAAGPSMGSSISTVTMYNLKRVEAGLRGQWLAPSAQLDQNNPADAQKLNGSRSNGTDNMDTEGWQDLDEYQREQEVVEGEPGPDDTEVELEVKPAVIDKEARKKNKKHRLKEEKRRKAKSRENAKS
jgi:hypothetical protein